MMCGSLGRTDPVGVRHEEEVRRRAYRGRSERNERRRGAFARYVRGICRREVRLRRRVLNERRPQPDLSGGAEGGAGFRRGSEARGQEHLARVRHRCRRCEAFDERGEGGGRQAVRGLRGTLLGVHAKARADRGDGQPLRAQEQKTSAVSTRTAGTAYLCSCCANRSRDRKRPQPVSQTDLDLTESRGPAIVMRISDTYHYVLAVSSGPCLFPRSDASVWTLGWESI